MCNKTLLLNESDNIVICIVPIIKGETFQIGSQSVIASENISIGHKIARSNISANEQVIRYGAPIGSAVSNIQLGEHVHLHNMRSDYIPSHTRSQQAGHRG